MRLQLRPVRCERPVVDAARHYRIDVFIDGDVIVHRRRADVIEGGLERPLGLLIHVETKTPGANVPTPPVGRWSKRVPTEPA